MRIIAIKGFIVLLSMMASPALADIFLYIDKEGVMHFTNVPTHYQYRVFLRERSGNSSNVRTSYKPDSNKYDRLIDTSSQKHGVDFALVKAIIRAESSFNPYAISTKGAEGLMQLMPETSMKMNVLNPFDPRENIEGGVKYVKYLLERFDHNLKLSLAAYNAGETVVTQNNGIPNYSETKNYVDEVLRYYKEYQSSSPKGTPGR